MPEMLSEVLFDRQHEPFVTYTQSPVLTVKISESSQERLGAGERRAKGIGNGLSGLTDGTTTQSCIAGRAIAVDLPLLALPIPCLGSPTCCRLP